MSNVTILFAENTLTPTGLNDLLDSLTLVEADQPNYTRSVQTNGTLVSITFDTPLDGDTLSYELEGILIDYVSNNMFQVIDEDFEFSIYHDGKLVGIFCEGIEVEDYEDNEQVEYHVDQEYLNLLNGLIPYDANLPICNFPYCDCE